MAQETIQGIIRNIRGGCAHGRQTSQGIALLVISALFAGGCANLPKTQSDTLGELRNQVSALEQQVKQTNLSITDMGVASSDQTTALDADLKQIKSTLKRLPKAVEKACRTPAAGPQPACPPSDNAVVVDELNRIIVGELENIWLDPPGINIVARIDTGASSSSIHAADLVEFERDGDRWVRFSVARKGKKGVEMERPVSRYVRVVQQADPSGTRRPVVALALQLGNVADTFEFTLADREHLDYEIILGRNFLTDVALVDVSRKFVQPKFEKTSDTANKTAMAN